MLTDQQIHSSALRAHWVLSRGPKKNDRPWGRMARKESKESMLSVRLDDDDDVIHTVAAIIS